MQIRLCPRCQTQSLKENYFCKICSGKFIYVDYLKKIIDKTEVHYIKKFSATHVVGKLSCSHCHNLMKKIYVSYSKTELDICTGCNLVWFDTNEWITIKNTKPKILARDIDLLEYGRIINKIHIDIDEASHIGTAEIVDGNTIPKKKRFMAFLGLLVLEKDHKIKNDTPLSHSIVLVCSVFSIFCWFNLNKTVHLFGISANASLLTVPIRMFSHFFLHANLLHLLLNMYCLWLFGRYIEDKLGAKKYVVLLFLSASFGAFIHVCVLKSPQQLIGASGGIFGIMTYYIWRYPRQRFLKLTKYGWVFIPGLFMGAWILFIQIISLLSSTYGRPHPIAYAVHIGGGFIGLIFAFLWKPEDINSTE